MRRSLSIFVTLGLLSGPLAAAADVLTIATLKLNEGCTLEQLQAIGDELNAYTGDRAQAELMVPYHGQEQGVVYAVVRSPSFAAYGQAVDPFQPSHLKAGSDESKLATRARECVTVTARSSVVTLK